MSSLIDKCRLCLVSSQNLVSISNKNLSDLIKNLLRLTLLPKFDLICEDCYNKMASFNEFMRMCQESEKVLMKDEREKSASEVINVKERPVDSVQKTRNSSKRQTKERVLHKRRLNSTKRDKNENVSEKSKRTKVQIVRMPCKSSIQEPLTRISPELMSSIVSDLNQPVFVRASPVTLPCNECKETFGSSKKASEFDLCKHTPKMDERCAHCFATFKTLYELKQHKKIHVSNIVGGMKAKFQEMFNEKREITE